MNIPLVIHVAHLSISFHLIMDFLSTTVGGILYWSLSKKDGIPSQRREYLLIGTALGALIGSRLIGALENPTLFFHPPGLLYYYASKTIIGGIAGGILGMEAVKLIIGHKKSTGDAVTIPLIVSIIIGRIGCLFTGVVDGTVGNPCHFLWCFSQGDGIPRHPTSLYEILFLIGILIYILFLKKHEWLSGVLFRFFIIAYFAFRFFIEFIKPIQPLVFSFSVIQVVCFLYILWYIYDIFIMYKKYNYGNTK